MEDQAAPLTYEQAVNITLFKLLDRTNDLLLNAVRELKDINTELRSHRAVDAKPPKARK